MIQSGTLLRIVDNTGAKTALCLKVDSGFKRRYAISGDIIYVSIRSLRLKRRNTVKVKKGELYKALLLRVKSAQIKFCGSFYSYFSFPCAILLIKKKKIMGTRIYGSISNEFRYTKYLKALTLSAGVSF